MQLLLVNNTAIGSQSMRSIVTGEFNTGHGFKALCSIVGGDRNTAIGAIAGQSITSGCDNVQLLVSVLFVVLLLVVITLQWVVKQ